MPAGAGMSIQKRGNSMHRKIWKTAAASALLASVLGVSPVFAASRIDQVQISLDWEGDVEAGEEIGEVLADTDSDEFVVNGAQFVNDNDRWKAGDTPRIQVDLTAEDGYTFVYKTSSHFSIDGQDANFKKASIYDGGVRMILELTLSRLEGSKNQVTGPCWEDYTAVWDEDNQADRYEIWLYRNNEVKNKVKTDDNSYDFSDKMTQKGNYKFRVRVIVDNETGDWSEFSDIYYLDADEAADNRRDPFSSSSSSGNGPAGDGTDSSMSGGGPAGSSNGSSKNQGGTAGTQGNPNGAGGTRVTEGWIHSDNGWWYRYADGSYPVNGWRQIDGRNYHFDENGYLMTGWQKLGSTWYYVLPQGQLATGWQNINEKWYYMDETGAMQTGWKQIGGKWYFLKDSGERETGWMQQDGKWYFLNTNGERLTCFQNINDKWYYFNEGGVMMTGWQKVGNDMYYMDATGVRISGTWTPDGHLLGENGAMIR